MGIDCKAVREIIHWSPLSDIECYVQETEQGGGDYFIQYINTMYIQGRCQSR